MPLALGKVSCPRAAATPPGRLTCRPRVCADGSREAAGSATRAAPHSALADRTSPWRRTLHIAASGTHLIKAATSAGTEGHPATAGIASLERSWQGWVQAATSGVAALLVAHSVLLQPPAAYGLSLLHHTPNGGLECSAKGPSSLAEEATLDADEEAAEWLEEYAQYVKSMAPQEQAPGCELCRTNRLMLEVTWDTVADRYYDPTGHFSQGQWAQQLLVTLQEAGGVLPTKNDAYRALDRMVSSLHDRYSQFLSPSKFREALHQPRPVERQYLAAQYVAAGVVIGGHSSLGGWYVESALAESPAEEAGVSRGDRILTVNGLAVDRLSPSEVTSLLRGPGGSTVEVGLVDKAGHTRWVELTRRGLPQPPTRQANLLAPGGRTVKYVRVHYFSAGTAKSVQQVLVQGEEEEVDGYILDLRNNPGGSFDAAVGLADMLLPAGAPITSTVRSGNEVDGEWVAGQLSFGAPSGDLPASLPAKPLVLLTNSSTASASEVLAGALHDNGRAAIVGETTFGKGVVQEYFGEPDGSGIKLTVAKYLTPSGYDITRQGGIRPDAVCHDHPRGLTGLPDTCIAKALHGIAAELDLDG